MARCSLLALSAALLCGAVWAQETANNEISFGGILHKLDVKDPVRNQPHKLYTMRLMKGRTYVIDLVSKEFDTYLRLTDAASQRIAEDDDGGGNLNSRIRFAPQADDNFRIIVTTFNGNTGHFVLKITQEK